ncbi:hypothetical protein [Hamadaea tsunoensis]|uniref:hypothetical protein n=1 Tax=Hamadaea tsunoensis TaxID=53368 RepID=UPI000402BFEC|nr:hypothetical protein [Hamadaea tsunoensis]
MSVTAARSRITIGGVTSFRSRRLENVFGAPINPDMPYAALQSLVTNRVTETADLEYKGEARLWR